VPLVGGREFVEKLYTPTEGSLTILFFEPNQRIGANVSLIIWRFSAPISSALEISMIQLVPQLRILLACQPVDFRCGIDGLAEICKQEFAEDPFSGALFVFRNRRCPCGEASCLGTAGRLSSVDVIPPAYL